MEPRLQIGLNRLDFSANSVGNRHRICLRLLNDADSDSAFAVEPDMFSSVLCSGHDDCDVSKPDRAVAYVGNQQLPELFGRLELPQAPNREFCISPLHSPRRQINVFPLQGGDDLGDRQISRAQPSIVNPNAHRVAPFARNHNVRYTGQALKTRFDLSFRNLCQLDLVVAIAV